MGNKSDPKFSVMPHGWRQLNLGNLCLADGDYGAAVPACSYRYDWPRFIRITDITERGFLKKDGAVSISPEDSKGYLIGKNDLLFARTGEPGRCYLHDVECNAAFAGYLIRFRVDENLALPGYVFQHTQSCAYKKWITGVSQKGAQANINAQMYAKMPIALPPLAEQRKIAEILRTWDEAIETAEAELNAKQERKRGLMQRVFEGAFQSISQGWNKVLLGDCFFERSETGNAGLPLLSITSGNGVVDREEIGRRDTSAVDKSKYLRICPGDIGYNTMRMWQGVCGLSKHEGIVSPAYTILRPRSETNPAFMYYLFKCPPMISRFHRRSQGLVKDTLNLKFPAFAKIRVNIPSQKEQAKIVQILEAADEEVEWLKMRLETLRTQKRGLMQKLLTGEVRVAA